MPDGLHDKENRQWDDEIIRRLFARDENALTAVQEQCGAYLTAFAARFLSDRRDREEAVNDALLRLWKSVPPQRPRSLSAFLTTLLRRSAIDIARRNSGTSQPPVFAGALEELEEILPAVQTTEDAVLSRELGRSISRWLRALSEREREIFMRRYYAACSVKEIAGALSVSPSTVEKELKKSRDGLRRYLKGEGYEL